MAYLFDDASAHHIRLTSSLGARSVSLWFYPDDSAVDCTLYSEHNNADPVGASGSYFDVRFAGAAAADVVQIRIRPSGGAVSTTSSVAAANVNAWNHVYAAHDGSTNTYLSLNGASLVNGSYTGHTATLTSIGKLGPTATAIQYMSGRIAEFGAWTDTLNNQGTGYTALNKGFPPHMIGFDYSAGGTLKRYTPLIRTSQDWVAGGTWTDSGPTVIDHCRVHRQFME